MAKLGFASGWAHDWEQGGTTAVRGRRHGSWVAGEGGGAMPSSGLKARRCWAEGVGLGNPREGSAQEARRSCWCGVVKAAAS